MRDGAFRPLAWFHSQHVERLFRAEVLRMLLRKELITEAIVDNLLSWRHSGFSAHGAVRVDDRQGAVRLGHYMIRCPIVLKRLSWEWEAGEIVYRSRPSRRTGPDDGHARWDVLEFLARVVDHIPEPSQQMVRYWGFYANAARGKRRKAAADEDTPWVPSRQDDEITRRTWLSWALLVRRVLRGRPVALPLLRCRDEDPRLHRRLRHRQGHPPEPRAPGSGARALGASYGFVDDHQSVSPDSKPSAKIIPADTYS